MLSGTPTIPVTEQIIELSVAPFEFHLTGSHYFGCARADSDIDFIVSHSAPLMAWLEDNGYTRMGEAKYHEGGDWELEGIYEKGNVQIQVSFSPTDRLLARDVLKTFFAVQHRVANQETRNVVWKSLISTLNSVRDAFDPVFEF